MELRLSPLGHTWVLDLDGTIVRHNGYLLSGRDELLPGAADFLSSIPEGDMVIIVTSRREEYRDATVAFLEENGIRYDHIIFEAPYGERIVVNDGKPSGLATGVAVCCERDAGALPRVVIDDSL